MQFESLKVFCDVARQRSFSRAAAANDLTQSAASQIVLQLEKRLGVKLVDRSTRPLQLTREGHVYYDGCRQLVERYLELEAEVRSLPTEIAPSVQVAAIYSVGLGDMSHYVQRFAEQYPGVEVHIEYLHPDRVYERVLDGAADFGLVSFPRKSRELAAMRWRDEEMVLACPPTHRIARQRTFRPAQLAGEKFVGFDKELVIRREVDRYLREHGIDVQIVHEFDNVENIKKAIEVGAGVALLPLPTLGREIADGTLVAVPPSGGRFVRPLGMIRRRNYPLGTYAKRFADVLKHEPDGDSRAAPLGRNGRRTAASNNGSSRGARTRVRSLKRTV
jgi:DNA-binding transcriptional LysR family regulator